MRQSGDGFIRCSDGRDRWGRFGAAGALFVFDDGTGERVLLQERSLWSHEGGTWSIPGGALDLGESAVDGALREASEEVGLPARKQVLGEYRFEPATDWAYTTVVVRVDEPFGTARNFETSSVAWVPLDEVTDLALHDGFGSAWPALRGLLEADG